MVDIQKIEKGFIVVEANGTVLSRFGVMGLVIWDGAGSGFYDITLSEVFEQDEIFVDMQVRGTTPVIGNASYDTETGPDRSFISVETFDPAGGSLDSGFTILLSRIIGVST